MRHRRHYSITYMQLRLVINGLLAVGHLLGDILKGSVHGIVRIQLNTTSFHHRQPLRLRFIGYCNPLANNNNNNFGLLSFSHSTFQFSVAQIFWLMFSTVGEIEKKKSSEYTDEHAGGGTNTCIL